MLHLSALLKRGFSPTPIDFNKFLVFLWRNGRSRAVIHLFSQQSSMEINAIAENRTIFVKALLKETQWDGSAELLKTSKIADKNGLFDSLVQGFCASDKDPEKGLSLLRVFLKVVDYFPSSHTFYLLLSSFCEMRKMDRVTDIMEVLWENRFKYPFDNYALSSVVAKMLIHDSRYLDVYELLMNAKNNLPRIDVFYYTRIIDGLGKRGYLDKALDVCDLAKENGITLNVVTYNSVINGLCRQGCLVEAFRLFNSLERVNILPTEVTYGTLIDALVNQGLVVDARMLFNEMLLKNLQPNAHIYNSLVYGYCKSNQLLEATKIFQDLEAQNVEADEFTVAAVMNCCRLKGDMHGAFKLFSQFTSKGLVPDLFGFMHLLRGLCSKGWMEEARSVSRYMLQTPSVLDLLKKAEKEVESDSVVSVLSLLCEQGRIDEVVAIFDEIGSIFFSAWRKRSLAVTRDESMLSEQGEIGSTKLEKIDNLSSSEDDGEMQLAKDFDSFYSRLHSLCINGEHAKPQICPGVFCCYHGWFLASASVLHHGFYCGASVRINCRVV